MNRVRRIALSLSVLGTLALSAAAQTAAQPRAEAVVAESVKAAQAQNKTVLVHFGASWCSWCKRLDAAIQSTELNKIFSDHYVVSHLTIQESDDKKALENPGAQEMVDAAGGGKAGVPVYLFIDAKGERIASSLAMPDGGNIGYPATPEEIRAFDDLLVRTAPRITPGERAQVVDYLSKQKF